MDLQDIIKLKLHEEIEISNNLSVLRVPNGCIYKFYQHESDNDYILTHVQFVPLFSQNIKSTYDNTNYHNDEINPF